MQQPDVIDQYFGRDGLLQQKLSHFEYRAQQLSMARKVFDCLRDHTHLLVEAGTGTGKTLAYLIPAILNGKRTVISTGTKTLQDQIIDHDVPLLRRHLFPKLRVVSVKGRRNYLCRRRLHELAYQSTMGRQEELRYLKKLQQWAQHTTTGDRADIPWLPDDFQLWSEMTASSYQCLGSQCPYNSSCFLTRLRIEAAQADLVVVNHHLFFADLALRRQEISELLPPYEAVIFDEAHQLEDIIGLYFGTQFSCYEVREWVRDLLGAATRHLGDPTRLSQIKNQCDHLLKLLHLFYQTMEPRQKAYTNRFALDDLRPSATFQEKAGQLSERLLDLNGRLATADNLSPELENAQRRGSELRNNLEAIVFEEKPDLIYWYELRSEHHDFTLMGTPIKTDALFRSELLDRIRCVVCTSATLTTSNQGGPSFRFLKDRLGFDRHAQEMRLDSPFDYRNRVLIYVPEPFPEPHQEGFRRSIVEQAAHIIRQAGGRSLLLFTSFRNMDTVYRGLQQRLDYPILAQGQKPKRVLLSEFKEKIESVLLATYSFWEGVDVPGESLTCLMIDKLPFEVPTDPIVSARLQNLEQSGSNPFYAYQIPRAVIHLRQGAGRLIRSSTDRGVIVIFDARLFTKSYGRIFRASLQPTPIVRDLPAVEAFLHAGEISPPQERRPPCAQERS